MKTGKKTIITEVPNLNVPHNIPEEGITGINNWYDKKNVVNNIDWKDYQDTDIITFNEHYSLHDSVLLNLINTGTNDLVLVLLFDPYWQEELRKYQTSSVQEWPVLILYFPLVKSIEIDYDLSIKGFPFQIYYMEITEKKGNNLVNTLINSCYAHYIKIIHSKELKVILYDKEENIIRLSKL
ncbi:MAG: hypothetical protein JSW28_03265 [Thermoplasmata archaeon]|nr:MAG: hypothetical protein JSW28_03265 [Thermoplasmata archaeon]